MEILSILLYIIAGVLFIRGIWILVHCRLTIKKVYTQARKDLEDLRPRMYREVPTREDILRFNKLARELKVPEFRRKDIQ